MPYLYLAIAIVAEVIATSALKASEGFTRLGPSVVVTVGYSIAFYFLSVALRSLQMGVAYAIWSGVGIALITLVGALRFREIPDATALIGMGLILIGVVMR